MLSERDRAVVYEMCRSGMSLEVLKMSFPQFDASDVEKVFNEQRKKEADKVEEEFTISCNCS